MGGAGIAAGKMDEETAGERERERERRRESEREGGKKEEREVCHLDLPSSL